MNPQAGKPAPYPRVRHSPKCLAPATALHGYRLPALRPCIVSARRSPVPLDRGPPAFNVLMRDAEA
jgi:hypothetical protein